MVDPTSLGAIIVSIFTGLAAIITACHIKRMHSGCIDCVRDEDTPTNVQQNAAVPIIPIIPILPSVSASRSPVLSRATLV